MSRRFSLTGEQALKVAKGSLAIALERMKRDGVPMEEVTVTNKPAHRTEDGGMNVENRTLFVGDNLDVLRGVEDEELPADLQTGEREYHVEARAVFGLYSEDYYAMHSQHKNIGRLIKAGNKKEAVEKYKKLRLFKLTGEDAPAFFIYVNGEQYWRGSPDWIE